MKKGKKKNHRWKEMINYIPRQKVLLYIILLIFGIPSIIFFCINSKSPALTALGNIGASLIGSVVLSGLIDITNGKEEEKRTQKIRANELLGITKCCEDLLKKLVRVYMKRGSLLFARSNSLKVIKLGYDEAWREINLIEMNCRKNIGRIKGDENARSILDSYYDIDLSRLSLCQEIEKIQRTIKIFEATGFFSHDEICILDRARIKLKNSFVSERKIEVDSIKEAFSLLIKIPEICSITKETIYYNHVNTFLTSNGKIEECESLSEKDITDAIDFENIKEEELVLKTGEGSIFDYHNGVLKG